MKTAILGGGTWGVALAKLLSENGNDVTVWSALPAEIDALAETSRHPNLPGVVLPNELKYTKDIAEAVTGSKYIIFAVASAYIRSTAKAVAPYITEDHIIIDVAKGMESGTLFTMTEVIDDEMKKCGISFPLKLVTLSGPTHAEEVARDIPTSIVSACVDEECAEEVGRLFMNSCMRVYTNTDIKGVELCGAYKNIIALAAGISRGMGYGDNTIAMLITRGIAEMTRIGLAMGCKRRTFAGLAGIGDLIVTCTSRHSRNNTCGQYIGEGLTYEEASKKVGMVVEGYYALDAGCALCEKMGVEMPIITAVYDIVKKGEKPEDAIRALMARAMKSELD
ncbi:MAG: NAD(P)-dependent glycerol-3-phosphate dehydrogenase [Ruminococcaceae bacterium]|nr:NAD(P)-dependent glycerol-3-phosphate dehydrogenase [Oscillospiraceae bacterium]